MDVEPYLARYLAALQSGGRREATGVAVALLQRGLPAERVITDLLSRAQTEIGLGWQQGRWTVAMEHQASAITDSALQGVVQHAMTAPGAIREGSRGRVLIACSESEWHVLPGQMAAEILRLRGGDVTCIGPAVPADELADHLGDHPPRVVAVTCSMPMSLVGAWRSISALRAIGMTIVCAGQGFGPDGRWGLALGADHWASDLIGGADLLLSLVDDPLPAPRGPAGLSDRIAEVRVLFRGHERLVEEAAQNAFARWPTIRGSDAAMRATREDLASTLRVIAAATLVDDMAVVSDYVSWFEAVLTGHDLPLAFVPSGFELLLGVLPAELACSRETARSGRAVCSGHGLGPDYSPQP
jgi:methanogenic corrinoid protein MtbC1